MSEHLRIGQLAAGTGKSIHALRYYESLGLMPFVRRDAGGCRQYDVQHIEWVLFLERLQRTGMTLSQMQQYTQLVSKGKLTLNERVDLLTLHLHRIDQQMKDLARSRDLLIAKLDFYRDWKSSGKRPAQWRVDAPKSSGPDSPTGPRREPKIRDLR
jgi:DNA-binding transcriptional MerR regulator